MQAVQKGSTTMYARVTIAQIKPGKMDEGIQINRDFIIPTGRQQQGFKGALLLTDQSSNKAIAITFWETEADMKAGESGGYYQAQLAKVASLVTAPPVREAYEVSIQE